MLRRAAAGLLLVGLAAGVWMLWPRGDPGGQVAVTLPEAVAPTTATSLAPTATTTTLRGTTTTTGGSYVVETVEEAEAILRELWFGWFEGIYNQDEDRIREVVATEQSVENAKAAFGVEFIAEPSPEGIILNGVEILRSDENCLVVWSVLDVSAFRGPGMVSEGVTVMRYYEGTWLRMSEWKYRGDLWAQDCDAILEPPS